MIKKIALHGLRVLNTRPEGQNLALNQSITEAGGEAIPCPTIEIVPIPSAVWLTQLPPLASVRYAIFTSINAVECFFNALKKQNLEWPNGILVIAIGKSTAKTLEHHKIKAHFSPKMANSEHLLALPTLQQINQQNVLLIKGEGGRTLIPETLNARGANLITLNVYRRTLPQLNKNELARLWQNDAIDIILLTSQEAMHNLFVLLGQQARTWLQQKPCLVISSRLGEAASTMGIKNITVCQPDSVMEALYRFSQG